MKELKFTQVKSLFHLDSQRDSLDVGNSEYCQSRDACHMGASRTMEGARVTIILTKVIFVFSLVVSPGKYAFHI